MGPFLKSLKMSQYADKFRKNKIKYNDLPDLKNQHLIDVGVDILKHRMVLLKAIKETIANHASSSEDEKDQAGGMIIFQKIKVVL